MQDFDLESLLMGADHSLWVKAAPIESDYGSKGCVNLPSSIAVSRFKVNKSMTDEGVLLLNSPNAKRAKRKSKRFKKSALPSALFASGELITNAR